MSINKYLEQFYMHDYLGGGAYIGFTGNSFVIFTTDGISIQNKIHLETNELKVLKNFVGRVTGAPFGSL